MRFISILLFICLLTSALARPADIEEQGYDKYEEMEESEYESEAGEPVIDDDASQLQNEGEVTTKSKIISPQRGLIEQSPHVYANGQASEDISESESSETEDSEDSNLNSNNDHQYLKQNHPNEYIESNDNNDQQETAQHFPNREHNNYKTIRRDSSLSGKKEHKRTETTFNAEEEPMLFESVGQNDERRKSNTADDNNENEYANEPIHYSNVRYYSSTNEKSRENMPDKNIYADNATNNRDRRQTIETEESSNSTIGGITQNSNTDIENKDEEAAIKRHINKLTNNELEQLLSTLSEDKKSLLTKIIMDNNESLNKVKISDNEDLNVDIKKREITKKASAIDENSLLEGNRLEVMKQIGNVNDGSTEIPSSTTLIFNMTKSELSPNVTTLSSEPSSSSDEYKQVNIATSSPDGGSVSTLRTTQATSKTANKREIKVGNFDSLEETDLTDAQNPNEDEGFSQDEQFCDSVNDESDLPDDSRNTRKRDIYFESNSDLADSLKSLEDSFPNAYDDFDPNLASNMAPLIRVKREHEDEANQKKEAGILSNDKITYIAYKPENDEEDEEANEFDDDGFYVRTSNLALDTDKLESDFIDNNSQVSKTGNSVPLKYKTSDNTKLVSDATSIGSDSDSVLSGSEGVDDNLMLSNCARNKRSDVIDKNSAEFEYNRENEELEKYDDRSIMHDKPQKVASINMNFPNYQENDAFGIPRNCDGEVNRYKRIRRLKHQPRSDNITSSNK